MKETVLAFPSLTAFYGAILALIYLGLSSWVVAGRFTGDVLIGDAGNANLLRRIRTHANFGEYVPFALVLIALLEGGGGSPGWVRTLLIVLLVSRLLHPVGMLAPKNSPQQFACRGGGILATYGVIAVTAVLLLLRTA